MNARLELSPPRHFFRSMAFLVTMLVALGAMPRRYR